MGVSYMLGGPKRSRDGGKAQALATKIEEAYTESFENVQHLHDRWWTAHSFWDGKQYIFYSQGRPRTKKAPSWRVRTTHNLVKPAARVLVSKTNQQRPGWECSVENMEYGSLMMARASEDLLEHYYFKLKWGRLSREADFWAFICGNGFIKRGWNPHKASPELWNITPFDVYPDSKATSTHDAHHIIVVHMMDEADIDGTFGKGTFKRLKESASEGGEEDSHWYRQEIRGHYGNSDRGEDLIRVYEYEEAPNAQNNWEGIKAFSSGKELLYEGELPGGRYSIYHIRYGEGGGRFWGTGFPSDTLDIQQEYNRTHSQIIELRNMHCLPAWVMPLGSVSKAAVINRPDARIEYNPNRGPAPFRSDPIPIPPSLENYAAALKQEFQDITGLHDVSFGKRASGVVSGKAIGQLKDSNDLQLGSFFEGKEECWSQLGEDILEDVKAYGDDEYTFSVLGAGRAPELRALRTGDINTSVRVRPGSMAYVSPSWATQNAKEFWQIGAFGDPSNPETLMRFRKAVGSVQGMEEFWGDESIDRLAARQEADLIFSGEPQLMQAVHADWPEDHLVHYDEHRRMYFSAEARRPENHQARLALARHMAEHLMQLHATEQGLPTYQQAFGVPLQEIQANIQRQMGPQGAPQPQTQQMPGPDGVGMVGGGDPFSNGAHLTPQSEQVDPEAQYL